MRANAFAYVHFGWFDWPEPSLTTALQGLEGVQGACCMSWRRFKHSEPLRTFSNCNLTEIARSLDFFPTIANSYSCLATFGRNAKQITSPFHVMVECDGKIYKIITNVTETLQLQKLRIQVYSFQHASKRTPPCHFVVPIETCTRTVFSYKKKCPMVH